MNQDRELRDTLNLFLKSSDDFIGTTEIVSHEIDTGDSKPFNVRSHMWSPYKEAKIDRELNRMLSLGVVEPSNSPYSNPIVPVSKKDGSTRLCLDARKLNKQTKPSSYPLPLINRILGRFKATRYLSTVDLKDAYWQVPLKQSDREKTAFKIPKRGLFQKMPFGLSGASQTMAALMDKVLGSDLEPYVYFYLVAFHEKILQIPWVCS